MYYSKINGFILFIFSLVLFSHYTLQENYFQTRNKSSETEKIKEYKYLVDLHLKQHPDSSRKYAFLILDLIKNDLKLKSELLFKIGLNYNYQSDYDNAFIYYKKSLELNETLKDSVGIGNCYYRIGLLKSVKGNYVEALDYCLKAINILDKTNDNISRAFAHNYLGIVFYITGDLEKAEKQMYKSLDFSLSVKDTINIALANEHLGILYIKKKDYYKAKNYIDKSLVLRKKINDNAGLAGSFENLAIINRNLKNFNQALVYYYKSIQIKKKFNSLRGIASSYYGIGVTYLELKNYDKAIQFLNKSLEIRKKINDKRGLTSSYARLSEAYEKLNNYNEALKYFKLSKEYSDSLLDERNYKNLAELKEKYDALKKEEKIKDLNYESRIYRNRSNYFIVISILLLIIIIIFYFAYNSKKRLALTITKQKNELEKLNNQLNELLRAKEKIYSIIAHDLRSPFQGILGASEVLENEIDNTTNDEKLYFIKGIRNLANQTLALLENLLEWTKFQTNKINFFTESTNLYTVLSTTINYLNPISEEKKIHLIFNIDKNININVDRNMLTSIIRNLVSNAIKFSNENGIIEIYTREYNSEVEIFVKDNGVGMNEEQQKNLFTLNHSSIRRGTKNEKGSGLGLLLCKEMIDRHNGKINVKSEVSKGTTISFTLSKNL